MNQTIKLKLSRFPKTLGELAHSNQFLKVALFSAFLICSLQLGLLYYLSFRQLPVITLTPEGAVYQTTSLPHPSIEIEKAVREYLKHRYNWTPKNVATQVKQAEHYILPSTHKVYTSAMKGVVQFATEKSVEQRVYPNTVKIDLKKKTAFIDGDRITAIQGLKAAGDLQLELSFESGPRTEQNPWGIYFSREKEFQ
jgi:hypothetical protein